MKRNFDKKFHTKPHNFKLGDSVLVSINPGVFNKSLPRREIEPYTIININHSMITARNKEKEITLIRCSLLFFFPRFLQQKIHFFSLQLVRAKST